MAILFIALLTVQATEAAVHYGPGTAQNYAVLAFDMNQSKWIFMHITASTVAGCKQGMRDLRKLTGAPTECMDLQNGNIVAREDSDGNPY